MKPILRTASLVRNVTVLFSFLLLEPKRVAHSDYAWTRKEKAPNPDRNVSTISLLEASATHTKFQNFFVICGIPTHAGLLLTFQ